MTMESVARIGQVSLTHPEKANLRIHSNEFHSQSDSSPIIRKANSEKDSSGRGSFRRLL